MRSNKQDKMCVHNINEEVMEIEYIKSLLLN